MTDVAVVVVAVANIPNSHPVVVSLVLGLSLSLSMSLGLGLGMLVVVLMGESLMRLVVWPGQVGLRVLMLMREDMVGREHDGVWNCRQHRKYSSLGM